MNVSALAGNREPSDYRRSATVYAFGPTTNT